MGLLPRLPTFACNYSIARDCRLVNPQFAGNLKEVCFALLASDCDRRGQVCYAYEALCEMPTFRDYAKNKSGKAAGFDYAK